MSLRIVFAGAIISLFCGPSGIIAQSQPVLHIEKCIVRADTDKTKTRDCTANAARICNGSSDCELPIGSNLTDGPWLPKGQTASVSVKFSCGGKVFARGPHAQNDHATLILKCSLNVFE